MTNLVQTFKSRPRLVICALLSTAVFFFIPDRIAQHISTKIIICWNFGSILYLGLALQMMLSASTEKMQRRAVNQNVGRWLVLCMVVIAAVTCISSLVTLLSTAKEFHGKLKLEHIVLAGLTLSTSWFFTQIMFAQHYAHEYYFSTAHAHNGGLEFPGTAKPDYVDFIYFACIIGTSAQTADVSFTNQTMRRIGLLHCVLAFFFNTTLIALAINVASGLI